MKIKVIHQWRDWLLKHVDVGNYSFINIKNKTVVHSILAENDMDAENQCQMIIKKAKASARLSTKTS